VLSKCGARPRRMRSRAGLEVLAEAGDGAEASGLAKAMAIDVAIIDVLMPSVSGISVTAELHEIQPRCKVLGLSVVDEPSLIADMLRVGAAGFALKTQPIEEILEAVRTVLGGVLHSCRSRRAVPSCAIPGPCAAERPRHRAEHDPTTRVPALTAPLLHVRMAIRRCVRVTSPWC
jgi:DNA-binding NarL/FixJ family response regulator